MELKLKLEKNNVLNGIVLYEQYDAKIIKLLLNSTLLNDKDKYLIFENEYKQLQKYLYLPNKQINKLKYKKILYKNKINIGRVYPDKSLGLSMIKRKVRNTLIKNSMVDIDISNCQPSLLYHIGIKNNIKLDYLKFYIDNREDVLNDIIKKYNCDRDEAKNLIICLMFLGSFKNWKINNNIDENLDELKIITNLKKDIKLISELIYNNNPELLKKITEHKEDEKNKNNKLTNIKASLLSYYLQDLENVILEQVYLYCCDNGYIKNNICSLCFDGILLQKELYNVKLLNELNIHINNKLGINLNFEQKEFKEYYNDEELILNKFEYKKEYIPITKDLKNITVETFNNEYLNEYLTEEKFNDVYKNYNTIIIQSTTSTGKTSTISKHIDNIIKKDSNKRFVSMVHLILLSKQHILNFKNIGLKSYQDNNIDFFNDNVAICINSILKMKSHIDNIHNTIIYIDEIEGLLNVLTSDNNQFIDKDIKPIFDLFIWMVNNCYKLILSDDLINDTVFELLTSRCDKKKIFLKNECIKYNGIICNKITDENVFYNLMKEDINNDKKFLFCSDSAKKTINYYNIIKKENSFTTDNILIYTGKKDYLDVLNNATYDWNNKYIFYSPKISVGINYNLLENEDVDKNLKDYKQDLYILINGKSCNSRTLYQMITRCRNIRNIYLYCNPESNKPLYNNLDECKKDYRDNINKFNKLYQNSTILNNDDILEVRENKFFKIYCQNKYYDDILNSNKIYHLEHILKEKGFIIKNYDLNEAKLPKKIINEMNNIMIENKLDLYEEWINEFDKEKDKYYHFNSVVNNLQIPENKFDKFKKFFIDEEAINDYYKFTEWIKSDEYINNKLKEYKNNNEQVKILTNRKSKILILKNILKRISTNNIYDLETYDYSKYDLLTDDEYYLIKKLFRISTIKPKEEKTFKKYIISMYRHITDIILSIRNKIRGGDKRDEYNYVYDTNIINVYMEIDSFTENNKNYDQDAIDYFLLNKEDAK